MPRSRRPIRLHRADSAAEEHFHTVMLNGWGTLYDVDGVDVHVFDVDERERAVFPELGDKTQIAFENRSLGGGSFDWREVAVPEQARIDPDEHEQGPVIADDDYVIQDARRGLGHEVYQGRRLFGRFETKLDAVHEINAAMQAAGFYPNVWYVNERGNTDLLDQHGRVIRSWV